MVPTGGGFEIDVELEVLLDHRLRHLPREAKPGGGNHRTVRQYLDSEIVLVEAVLQL